MLSRVPPVRRSIPLALAVFAVGAGIGALAIAASDQPSHKHLIIKRVVTSATVTGATATLASTAAVTSSTTSTQAAPPRPAEPTRRYQSTVPAGAQASFGALEGQLAGPVGLAVAPLGAGPIETFGQVQVAHAWSTSKVPVIVTLLHDYENRGQVLGPADRNDAALAVEQSDNDAIDALFAELEQIHGGLIPASAAMEQTLRRAGDETTVVNTAPNDEGFTTEGQTEWSVGGEVTFYRALARGCLLNQQDTGYLLGLMSNVIPSQRWGAGSAGYPSAVSLAFKGGWGPESGGPYQVRQTAIVGSGAHGYVVSMLALPASGSFSDGTNMLTALATWVRQHLDLNATRPPGGCSGSQ